MGNMPVFGNAVLDSRLRGSTLLKDFGNGLKASRALELLRRWSGISEAQFRESQEDAIRHIVAGKGELLVVQKTGLGQELCLFHRCQIAAGKLRRGGRPAGQVG